MKSFQYGVSVEKSTIDLMALGIASGNTRGEDFLKTLLVAQKIYPVCIIQQGQDDLTIFLQNLDEAVLTKSILLPILPQFSKSFKGNYGGGYNTKVVYYKIESDNYGGESIEEVENIEI